MTEQPGSEAEVLAEVLAAIGAARADLHASHAELQQAVADLDARPPLSEEERERLEEQALSGDLGEDVRTLVQRIRTGEDTWEAVLTGSSPHGSLLQAHLTALLEEHLEDIELAWEDLLDEQEARGTYL